MTIFTNWDGLTNQMLHRLNSFLLKFIPDTTYAIVDKIELSFQSTSVIDGKIAVDNNNGKGYVF